MSVGIWTLLLIMSSSSTHWREAYARWTTLMYTTVAEAFALSLAIMFLCDALGGLQVPELHIVL